MKFLFYILLDILVFIITYVGVEIFFRWSLQRKLLDIPNERSSHTTPTVRGGGLIIVLICLTAYTLYTFFVTENFQWSYLIGASLIALISWLDDLYSISFDADFNPERLKFYLSADEEIILHCLLAHQIL